MELRAIREQMNALPPPAPAGSTIREWFAGLALGNPTLMQGLSADQWVAEALRLADELVSALAAPKVPTLQSMRAPTEKELLEWDAHHSESNLKKEHMAKETVIDAKVAARQALSRRSTLQFDAVLPAPLSVAPTPQQVLATRARGIVSGDTRYVMLGDGLTQDQTTTSHPKQRKNP